MTNDQDLLYLLPKKPLTKNAIVLDVDETLVHTEEDMKSLVESDILSNPNLSGDAYIISLEDGKMEMWGTKRPHLDEFLLFCFTYFDKVCVWSAGQTDYVHALVDVLFAGFRKPDIVFTFDDCVQNEEGDWIKPLEKFYKHPKAKGKIFPETTFIIDDRDYTFEQNAQNGVLIPAYCPKTMEDIQDEEDHLNRLKRWLMYPSSRFTKDIRSLNKSQIFDQTTEEHTSALKTKYKL